MCCMLVISLILSCLVLACLKTRHGRNIISLYYFFLQLDALSVYRASSVCSNACNSKLLCSAAAVCCVSRTVTEQQRMKFDGQWVNGNEEPAGDICHQYSSVVTAIIPYSRTTKLQYTLLGDYWECVRPARLPVLTWVPSSVPPGNNIQDTFLIGSATDTTLLRN